MKDLLSHCSQALNLAHFAAMTLIQKLKHNRTLSAHETVSEFLSTVLQPSLPLDYYAAEPHSAEGKIRNRLTSCKSFSGRASALVTDLQAILDPSVVKSSNARAPVDEEEEGSEGEVGDESGEDDFFDQLESSDHDVDDDGWESGSVHSQNGGHSTRRLTTSTDSKSESGLESDSVLDASTPDDSNPKAKPKVKPKPKLVFEDDDGESTPDSCDSDFPPLPSHTQKTSKASGAGSSTFLPSLSVGYIPGTGDSDPEEELEVVDGEAGRKNRRGQRARRA